MLPYALLHRMETGGGTAPAEHGFTRALLHGGWKEVWRISNDGHARRTW